MIQASLALRIQRLVLDMPMELVTAITETLQEAENGRWEQIQAKTTQVVSQPGVRNKIIDFINYWRDYHPQISIESVTLALLTAAQVAEHSRTFQQLEIVWTGPDSQIIPLRRTDQALLQLIREAKNSLHIVSFAVYKAEKIIQALITAADRGVAVSIYLETPDASEGRMSFDTVQALGKSLIKKVKLYIWPKEKRQLTEDGKFGSLHAKIALADSRMLMISSANLTDYAMTLNMEMGVLVSGGSMPKQVESLLMNLVENGIFERI